MSRTALVNSSRNIGAVLRSLFAEQRSLAPEYAQPALDLLATLSGVKHAALFGFDDGVEAVWPHLSAALPRDSYHTAIHPHWIVRDEIVGLPDWYADELVVARAAAKVRLVWRADTLTPPLPPVTADDEAELFGYPACCVREYYRRRRLFHRFTVKRINQFAGTDEAAARSYVAAEVPLSPSTAGERRAFAAATGYVLAPYTSIAMCRACTTNEDSAARQISAAYRHLADQSDLADLLLRDQRILSAPNHG